MYDLRVYQWLYPFIAVTGVALIILVYARTEEKIVIAKTHPMKIKFMDALREVAKLSTERKTGARGLRAILETAMTEPMYELPSRDDVNKCIITKETIKGTEKAVYKMNNERITDQSA